MPHMHVWPGIVRNVGVLMKKDINIWACKVEYYGGGGGGVCEGERNPKNVSERVVFLNFFVIINDEHMATVW